MRAELQVEQAGPLVTLQDTGRRGLRRYGIPRSGPMDRAAHAAANLALGNDAGATAIEVSRAGLVIRVTSGPVTLAVTGGDPLVERDRSRAAAWSALTLATGERLRIGEGATGSWAYLAVAGRLTATAWLGSTATHGPSGLGGGPVASGDTLVVEDAAPRPERVGPIPRPAGGPGTGTVRVVLGPQAALFDAPTLQTLTSATWTLSTRYDRMGVRLDGPHLPPLDALSIPSGPIVRGSLQVDGDGVPSLLLADHQTTGGYPRIATVLGCDADVAAQRRPGDTLQFEAVEPHEAIEAAWSHAAAMDDYLALVASPGRTLEHRLARANLIGHVDDTTA